VHREPFNVYDRDGLFLLVNPGGSKLWRWRYRFDSKRKAHGVGRVSTCDSRSKKITVFTYEDIYLLRLKDKVGASEYRGVVASSSASIKESKMFACMNSDHMS
jgi:hypothetical protein